MSPIVEVKDDLRLGSDQIPDISLRDSLRELSNQELKSVRSMGALQEMPAVAAMIDAECRKRSKADVSTTGETEASKKLDIYAAAGSLLTCLLFLLVLSLVYLFFT